MFVVSLHKLAHKFSRRTGMQHGVCTYGNHWRNWQKVELKKNKDTKTMSTIVLNIHHTVLRKSPLQMCRSANCMCVFYLIHHQPVLKGSQVSKPKDHKNSIPFPIHLVQWFPFGHHLRDEIGGGGLGGGHPQLKDKGIFLGKGAFGGLRRWRWCFLGRSVHGRLERSNGRMIDPTARRRGDGTHRGSIHRIQHPRLYYSVRTD